VGGFFLWGCGSNGTDGGGTSTGNTGDGAGGSPAMVAGGTSNAGALSTGGAPSGDGGNSSAGGDFGNSGAQGGAAQGGAAQGGAAQGGAAQGGAAQGGAAHGGAAHGGSASGGGAQSSGGSGGALGTTGITCSPQTWDDAPIGWATQGGGTTGGGQSTPVVATTLSQLNAAVKGSNAAVIHVSGKISGTVSVGSNKTILGLCGAQINGSLDLSGSSNVIVRNLKVVGNNCSDSPSDCSAGADAVHVQGGDTRLWFDHMDISDGSDGNLDVTHGADFITISWTKFHYSTKRTDPVAGANGHRFCNLIGHDDANASEDTGHLNVTFHHVWWADNVNQRMPRVRFGKVHVFNSLYTAAGDSACIEVGVSCNIRSESNVFQGVSNTVDSSHANGASIIQSIGNQGSSTNIGSKAFSPPYAYKLEPVTSVASDVMSGAGPK
jgi:pectate lyase